MDTNPAKHRMEDSFVDKLCSVDQAVGLIKNGDTVNLVASGGGFQDADTGL